jgi:hypothetical protein
MQWYLFSRIWVGAVLSAEKAMRVVNAAASSFEQKVAQERQRAEEEARKKRGDGDGGSRFKGRR